MKYLLIFLLIVGCGTRKTSQQSTVFKSDSISIENKRILKQEIELRNIYLIKPFDSSKPIIIDGKEYFNATIVFDKTIIEKYDKDESKIINKGSTEKIEKAKESDKTDYTILYLGLFFILCLFIFLWFKFKKPI